MVRRGGSTSTPALVVVLAAAALSLASNSFGPVSAFAPPGAASSGPLNIRQRVRERQIHCHHADYTYPRIAPRSTRVAPRQSKGAGATADALLVDEQQPADDAEKQRRQPKIMPRRERARFRIGIGRACKAVFARARRPLVSACAFLALWSSGGGGGDVSSLTTLTAGVRPPAAHATAIWSGVELTSEYIEPFRDQCYYCDEEEMASASPPAAAAASKLPSQLIESVGAIEGDGVATSHARQRYVTSVVRGGAVIIGSAAAGAALGRNLLFFGRTPGDEKKGDDDDGGGGGTNGEARYDEIMSTTTKEGMSDDDVDRSWNRLERTATRHRATKKVEVVPSTKKAKGRKKARRAARYILQSFASASAGPTTERGRLDRIAREAAITAERASNAAIRERDAADEAERTYRGLREEHEAAARVAAERDRLAVDLLFLAASKEEGKELDRNWAERESRRAGDAARRARDEASRAAEWAREAELTWIERKARAKHAAEDAMKAIREKIVAEDAAARAAAAEEEADGKGDEVAETMDEVERAREEKLAAREARRVEEEKQRSILAARIEEEARKIYEERQRAKNEESAADLGASIEEEMAEEETMELADDDTPKVVKSTQKK